MQLTKNSIQQIIDIAENLGWTVDTEEDNFLFTTYSPAEKCFCIELSSPDIETLKKDLAEFIDGFDVSYETYLWLDEWGHGKNGAPYDMKELYEDIEWCLDKTLELYRELFAN